MRTYILTDTDVVVINEYIRGAREYDGYVRSIVTRYKQNMDRIKMHTMLLDRLIETRENPPNPISSQD